MTIHRQQQPSKSRRMPWMLTTTTRLKETVRHAARRFGAGAWNRLVRGHGGGDDRRSRAPETPLARENSPSEESEVQAAHYANDSPAPSTMRSDGDAPTPRRSPRIREKSRGSVIVGSAESRVAAAGLAKKSPARCGRRVGRNGEVRLSSAPLTKRHVSPRILVKSDSPAVASLAMKSPARRRSQMSPARPTAKKRHSPAARRKQNTISRNAKKDGGALPLSPKKRSREEEEVQAVHFFKKSMGEESSPSSIDGFAFEEKEVPETRAGGDTPSGSTEKMDGLVRPPSKKPTLEEKRAGPSSSGMKTRIAFDGKSPSRRRRSRKYGRRSQTSTPKSSKLIKKANVLDSPGTTMATPEKRRDTFAPSKARSPASLLAMRLGSLDIFNGKDRSPYDTTPYYATPMKEGGMKANAHAISEETAVASENEPNEDLHHGKEEDTESVGLSLVKNNLRNLTSIEIEDRMGQLFQDRITEVYNHPCVSARIFAAMSTVYEDHQADDFAPLLPFLRSLVDAEIIALKNRGENEPCFVKKKVCFSGFDYSSTTNVLGKEVGRGGGDMRPSIEALVAVLRRARELSNPAHRLGVAIKFLRCMIFHGNASEACARTMEGYFPSSRYDRAIGHYLEEMKDIQRYVVRSSRPAQASDRHFGVRHRLDEFIGRSVRYRLREMLNTIPEDVVGFNVEDCEERWGRAVEDRSISSVLNFALKKVHEFVRFQPTIFGCGVQTLPNFFRSEASRRVQELFVSDLNDIDESTYEDLAADIAEARSFLFRARACKFVLELLRCPGVEEHIAANGGWASVESIAGTFYDLNLHEGSENEHFVQLREVPDLVPMLEKVDRRLETTVYQCEFCIRRLRRRFDIKSNQLLVRNLKAHLAGERGEYFPLVVVMK